MDSPSAIGHWPFPATRVVLLGASNLARSISTILETSWAMLGGPLEVMTALGHGRSYGAASSILGRELPGILECRLWEELVRRPPRPTVALLTDIGNDVVFEVPPEKICQWVQECLERLLAAGAPLEKVIVTQLPTESMQQLEPWRFRLFRTLYFPRCGLAYEEVLSRAHALSDALAALGERYGIIFSPQSGAWYGFDPIHMRRVHWPAIWREILAPWNQSGALPEPARGSVRRWFYIRSRVPDYRRVWGLIQRGRQPGCTFADGTTVALY